MKNYKYILSYGNTYESVYNSGYTGATDWILPDGGLAVGWNHYVLPAATAQIVTPAGFTGNAQRYLKTSTIAQGLYTNINIPCPANAKIKLKFKYASDIDWDIYVNNFLIDTAPANALTPTDYEISFTPDYFNITRISIYQSGDTGEIILDEVRFEFIETAVETLTKNPIGWNDLGISFVRNDVYKSVLRSFSLSLKFPKKPGGGGTQIETSYYLDGISANVEIEIYQLNPQTNDYDLFYTGIIDFNPARFKIEKNWIEAGIIDSDKLQKFKARDEINFDLNSEISADNTAITAFTNAPIDIIFKPIDIYLNVIQYGLSRGEIGILQNVGDYVQSNYFSGDSPLTGTGVTTNEIGDRLNTQEGDVVYHTTPPEPPYFWAENTTPEIYTNSNDYDVQLLFKDVTTSSNNSYVLMSATGHIEIAVLVELKVYDSDDILISTFYAFVEGISRDNPSNEKYFITVDLEYLKTPIINVPAGGKATLETTIRLTVETGTTTSFGKIDYRANLDFTEISLSIGQTPSTSYYPFEAFTRLIQLMTSETTTTKLLDSNYLGRLTSSFIGYESNGPGAFDAITTGWNLRQFPSKAFNVNFKDLFTAFSNVHALGMGYDRVNDRFYIEPIEDFYDASYLMFDLGEIASLVKTPYQSAFESKINSGYTEKGDYEDFQGVNEYNLQSEHSMPLPVKKTKDVRPKYRYDSIGVELTRRVQYLNASSKDTKGDEDIFIIKVAGGYTIQGGTNLSGFDGIDQYYNIDYTPRENLIRNAGYFNSALWNHDKRVKFVKATKDSNITYTNQNGILVDEFDDLTSGDLLKLALFQPEQYEFEAPLTPAMLAILNTNPHGYIRFTFNYNTYEGFLLSLESGYFNRKATYKLVAKPITTGDNYVFENDDNYVFEDDANYVFD